MSNARFPCPECEAEMGYSNATRCKSCGWEAPKRSTKSEHHIPDSCEYVAGTERCRYPATMSPGTLGGGPWYCRFHFWDRGTSMADNMVVASRDYDPAKREPTADELEAGAREVAKKLGVDPNLSPKERFLAVRRAWMEQRKAV